MSHKHPSKKKLQSLCAEVHPDDGVDPADFFRPARKRDRNQRKAHQLCHQVADTLNLTLSAEFGDELGDLRVVEVTPAPDASQLLVLVAPAVAGIHLNEREIVARLAAVAGKLRTEIASAITRKRAPKLLFQFMRGDSEEARP